LIALSAVLALALPAAASAQLLDPILEQYAPSTEQIDKKVKEGDDDGRAGDDGKQGDDAQAQQGGAEGGVQQGGEGEVEQGGADGEDHSGDVGGGVPRGGDGGGTPPGAQSGGPDARVLSGLPVTWFDFVAFAIATGLLLGTAAVLRRLSRSPTVEG
jgi:hypothetical protein